MWNDEITQDLMIRWNEGQSADDISRACLAKHRVSFSRSAIVGKVHRLRKKGIPLRGGQATRPRRELRRSKSAPSKEALQAFYPTGMPVMDTDFMPLVVGIANLEDHHCRYMHGDAKHDAYCGRTSIPGQSWCRAHAKRVWGTEG